MEQSIIITWIFFIASAVFFTSCDSLQLALSAHNDLGTHAASEHDYQLIHLGVLPRKLKLREDQLASVKQVYNGGDQDLYAHNAEKDAFSGAAGKAHNKETRKRKHAPITTWREWVEAQGSDTSQYFTMDYSRVRRRRPIHNKSFPVAP
ncbi:hypothetical protein POM88_054720 [Heracleum sosnowskyi]|uniref:Uncharacterized protein n=1 Tax=Heracleum sosnowskyi TaxID=360622 RepID=A0AAD8GN00_9APIA|nr:hypothetical protein POM88_054720 [Heracleum sosnowskyi]